MRKTVLILSLTAAMAAPSLAMARSHCERSSHNRKVTGTVLGAAGGALIGGAVGGHGAAGPLLGAAGGAMVGNQLARKKCYAYHSSYRRHYRHHYG